MLLRRALLLASSLAAAASFATACSGRGGTGGRTYLLGGGTYELTIAGVASDSCWPADDLVPPAGVAAIDLLVTASGENVTIVPNPAARFYFQPLAGAHVENDLPGLFGNGTLVATTGCSVAVTTSGGGLVTADDLFTLSLTAALQAMSAGTAGGCAALQGGTWPGATIPFPTLTEPTNGGCAVSFEGTAVRPD